MSRRVPRQFVTLVLVAITCATGAMAQIVSKPALLGSVSSQPAASPAASPANQPKGAQSNALTEKAMEKLNQNFAEAGQREAQLSTEGLDPGQPKLLREGLATYMDYYNRGLAAEAAAQLARVTGMLEQGKHDVSLMKACLSLYEQAQVILRSQREIGDDTTRQDVSRRIQELRKLFGPLQKEVATVDQTLKTLRGQEEARRTFDSQHPTDANTEGWRLGGSWGVDRYGRRIWIPNQSSNSGGYWYVDRWGQRMWIPY
jgi:hypothetical protein